MKTQPRSLGLLQSGGRPWNAIHNWVYWLDGPRLDQIGATNFELAVIDYSADGSAAGEFTPDQIEALRHATCERRVLAYLSAGEAEDYRFYWQPTWRAGSPGWIAGENPQWRGNYLVRYWDPAWQAMLYQYLDRIIAAGFDGVYLDRVDAYAEPYAAGHEQEMVDLVRGIAAYARSRSPLGEDFGVFVQNAEELAVNHPEELAVVTGIGREETYVQATNRPVPSSERSAIEAQLNAIRGANDGRLVLTIDYADRAELVNEVYDRAMAQGFVPYVTHVGLNNLRLNPGHEPLCAIQMMLKSSNVPVDYGTRWRSGRAERNYVG